MVDDLVSDTALERAEDDRLDHTAIVKVAADIVLATKPPVNIALFGAWGSGKSSFLASLRTALKRRSPGIQVVRYDAWKYGGRALKVNFIESLSDGLGIDGNEFKKGLGVDHEVNRLKLWKYLLENWGALLLGLLVAAVIAALWFFATSGAAFLVSHERGFGRAMDVTVAGVGTVLGLALIALLVGPKVLDSAVVKVTTPAPQTDDQFAFRFKELVDKATDNGKKTLVVLVDELDRCSPKDVVATLVDLKTFLEVPGCVFIVAADREVLESALQELPQTTPIRESDPYYSTPGAFLDKIFQHQLSLPPLRPQTLTKFARDLVTEQGGVWAELRNAQPNDKLFLEVIYLLIPVHVRSPRRVKVLLNHYATTVRTAQSRGLDWLPRASEMAVYTVLQVEFPRLAADLATAPMLLTHLRGAPVPPGAEQLQRLVDQYRGAEGGDSAEPAGLMLESGEGNPGRAKKANHVLNNQLRSYLAKAAAQDIDDPQPNLFYMQSAGSQHGITDPEVGHVIDVAADLSPDEVLKALDGQPASVLTTAAHLLAQQAEHELGPGRATIVESLCRLLETMDQEDLRQIADRVEPIVRAVTLEEALREGAIPGAFTLGVITGRTDLVDDLVAKYDADEFAEKGLLRRLGPVLGSGDEHHAETLRNLFLNSYRNHPEATHELLRTLPLDTAFGFWAVAKYRIDELLSEMAEEAATALGATTRRTSTVEILDAAERWRDLMDAVLARTDDAVTLVSGVLMLGQLNNATAVQTAVLDREDAVIDRINDPRLRTEHSLVAMIHAPIKNCGWWAEQAIGDVADETLAKSAVVRLLDELPAASSSLAQEIGTATLTALRYLDKDGLEAATSAFINTTENLEWTDDADMTAQRTALYVIAEAMLAGSQAKQVREALVNDLVAAFDSYFTPETVTDVLSRVRQLDVDTATLVDVAFEGREPSQTELLSSTQVRLTARTVANLPALPLDVMLEVLPLSGPKDQIVNNWLKLNPPVQDYIQVSAHRGAESTVLGAYAQQLTVEDRTTLWLAIPSGYLSSLSVVGQHGVNETAFIKITEMLAGATTQTDRTDLVNRAMTAQPTGASAASALAELVLALLQTAFRGDGQLAAKLAPLLSGRAHGHVRQLRAAFDAEVALPNHKLTQGQQARLRELNLLSKKKDVLSRAADSVRGRKKKT